ncbi:hypothetical protein A0H81_11324 [Grifola frondosa]|uniref:Uncharacterized protein n=1 Tax=Grifola frondosa TaxID=5627 RepID=A0A1C7M0W9_GRIFR|nr:hypothetical protein A0H81_11324 [Grifola frondosa]
MRQKDRHMALQRICALPAASCPNLPQSVRQYISAKDFLVGTSGTRMKVHPYARNSPHVKCGLHRAHVTYIKDGNSECLRSGCDVMAYIVKISNVDCIWERWRNKSPGVIKMIVQLRSTSP